MSQPRSRGASVRLLGALALGAAFLATPPPGRAQEDDLAERRQALFAGTHVLRRILFDYGFTPVEDFADLKARPDQVLLIVLGDTTRLAEVPGGLERFVRAGGAALVATDKPVMDPVRGELNRTAGVRVSPQTVGCVEVPRPGVLPSTYRGLNFCPFADPVPGARVNLFRDPRPGAAGPLRVATNVPSMLFRAEGAPETVENLARLPESCYLETPAGANELGYPPLFAVGGDLGRGRVLVMADHSVFINQMMLPTDNGNVEFTYNCLNWLRGDRHERRRVLFVEDGVVQTQFNIPLRSARLTKDEVLRALWARRNQITGWAGDALDRWQQDEGADEALGSWLDDRGVSPPRLVRYALIGLTALLVLSGLYALGTRVRRGPEKGLPALGADPAGELPPVIEQRHAVMLRCGNVWEAARELTRQWFAARGAPPSAGPPEVEASGGWWQRRRARALVESLWRLAHAETPARVSPGQLRRLLRRLEELEGALGRGSVRLRWEAAVA